MESAKEIARDMLEAINVDSSSFFGAMMKWLISFPVSLGYLGYDFIDTEYRWENQDDKFRFARLVNRGVFNRDVIEQIIRISFEYFISRINLERIAFFVKNISG